MKETTTGGWITGPLGHEMLRKTADEERLKQRPGILNGMRDTVNKAVVEHAKTAGKRFPVKTQLSSGLYWAEKNNMLIEEFEIIIKECEATGWSVFRDKSFNDFGCIRLYPKSRWF